MKRRRLVWSAASVVALIAIIVVVRRARRGPEEAAPAQLNEVARTVEERAADPGHLGVVLARESVDLVTKIDGRLDSIPVRLGDRVARGQVVGTLDLRPVRRELAMGDAQLEAARADVAKAELDLAEAKERYERRQAPIKAGIPAVSGDELAAAEYRFKQAGPSLQAAKARVAERQARVEQLRQTVEDATVRAPFDGVIAARFADPGAIVGPQKPIVRLISASDLWVRFAASEESAASLSAGQKVNVNVNGVEKPLDGIVEKVAPEIDAASRMVFAEARLAVPEGVKARILSGRVARVFVASK